MSRKPHFPQTRAPQRRRGPPSQVERPGGPRRAPTFQRVLTRLREDIVRGVFPPGSPLRLQDVADRYGTSLMPVREAFHRLTSEELVVMHPRRGATVCAFDRGRAREIYDVRKVLMGHAARLAAPHITPRTVAVLERLTRAMEQALKQKPPRLDLYLRLNDRFHRRLYGPCGNALLIKMIRTFDTFARMAMYRYFNTGPQLAQFNREHREIVVALRRGDAARVERLIHKHYGKSTEDLVDALGREAGAGA